MRTAVVGSLLLLLAVAATERGSRVEFVSPPAPFLETTPAPSATTTAHMDARGGHLEAHGVFLAVPPGALARDEQVEIAFEDHLPAPLPPGCGATSPVLMLEKSSATAFLAPVNVTIHTTGDATEGAFYWDPGHGIYRSLTVTARDAEHHTLSFETVHFTQFVTATSSDGSLDVDTGFRPELDGFSYRNSGFDLDEAGWCLGMSSTAVWYFETHHASGEHLATALAAARPAGSTLDAAGMEMARLAQDETSNRLGAKHSPVAQELWNTHKQGDAKAGLQLLNQLKVTQAPQIMILESDLVGGHAVVAFGYRDGAFQIYDPNFPDETVTFAFDPRKGFGAYTRANGKLESAYTYLPFYSFLSLSSFATDVDFEKMVRSALDDAKTLSPIRVVIDAPTADAGQTAHVSRSATTLPVQGRVIGGAEFIHRVYGPDKKLAHPKVVLVVNYGAQTLNTDAKLGDAVETPFHVDMQLDKVQTAIQKHVRAPKGSTVDHFTVSVYLSSSKVDKNDYDEASLEGRDLETFTVSLEDPPAPPSTTPGIVSGVPR